MAGLTCVSDLYFNEKLDNSFSFYNRKQDRITDTLLELLETTHDYFFIFPTTNVHPTGRLKVCMKHVIFNANDMHVMENITTSKMLFV